jgi:hypothetical protein
MIIECRDAYKYPRSVKTTLATGKNKFGSELRLIHKTEGVEPAGAAMRMTKEAYGAIFTERSGTTGGQWFLTLEEATALFNLWNVETVAEYICAQMTKVFA